MSRAGLTPRQQGAMALLLLAVGGYYLGTALTSPHQSWYSPGYHQMMAEAFLAGQTSLLIRPAPELLALPDPYDPQANAPYRVHDLSLYGGEYYTYWGPAPALLWFAPIRALTGQHFSQAGTAALFCWIGAVLSCLVLIRLRQRSLPATPFWMLWAGAA